jgi:hypothetical protein
VPWSAFLRPNSREHCSLHTTVLEGPYLKTVNDH